MNKTICRHGDGEKQTKRKTQNMKKISAIITVISLMTLGIVGTTGCKSNHSEESGHVHTYTCPHHPEVVQNSPGTCPKCGMKLQHKD